MKAWKKRQNQKTKQRRIAIISRFKRMGRCIDCGTKYNLTFDHVRDRKRFEVCEAKSMGALRAEIRKCVLRCVTCHQDKTTLHNKLKKRIKSFAVLLAD